jgi:hypothetical protein
MVLEGTLALLELGLRRLRAHRTEIGIRISTVDATGFPSCIAGKNRHRLSDSSSARFSSESAVGPVSSTWALRRGSTGRAVAGVQLEAGGDAAPVHALRDAVGNTPSFVVSGVSEFERKPAACHLAHDPSRVAIPRLTARTIAGASEEVKGVRGASGT